MYSMGNPQPEQRSWLDKADSARQMGVLLIVISATAFGLLAIFAKYAYEARVNVLTLLSLRFLIAAIVMWLVLLICKQNPRVAGKELMVLLALGTMGYGLMSSFFFNAVKLIPASIASIMLYTYPVIVTLLSAWINKEEITKYKVFSLLLSSLGLVLVVGVVWQNINPRGLLYGGMAALVYSLYIVISNKLVGKIEPLVVTTYVVTAAAAFFGLIGGISGTISLGISLQGWLAVLGIAIISSVVAILTFFQGMRLVGPARASIISTLEPVVTALAAFILFSEAMTWLQVTGGILVIAAVILIQKDQEER